MGSVIYNIRRMVARQTIIEAARSDPFGAGGDGDVPVSATRYEEEECR